MVQIITNSNWWGGGVWVYKYKWSVDYYEDLPTSWMKVWDTYNVINEHTTAPVFPAWTNVAWTWTEWDALWWSIDLSEYQKKLVEWAWIDIDWDTNEISVESTVINWAAAWATAVQPWDDISDLNNDAGYITSSDIPTNVSAFNNDAGYITSSDIPTNVSAFNNDAGYLVSSDLKQSDWNEADSSAIDYIKNKPTIWNATLTIQKNGTTVNTITMNATSNVTANISVPTKTSDINNDSWFITSSDIPTDVSSFNNDAWYITSSDLPDLSWYQLKSNLVTDLTNPDNTHYPSALAVASAISSAWWWDVTWPASSTDWHLAVFDWATGKIIKDWWAVPTPTTVVDALDSTSTTSALSANQWKVLKDAIDNLSWLWKFLSLWNSSTGQPISFPLATPYAYTTWDWFMVEVVDTTDPITNYKPTWSSYTWTASTTVESWTVKQWDVYIYDGTDWLLQVNNEPQVSFSEIAWNATDNTSLSNALNAKANDSDVVKLTGNQTVAWTKTFSTSPVVPSKTSDATNTWTAIATEAQVYKKQDTISDLTTIRNGASAWATALQPSAISDTAYGSGWDADTTHAPSKNAVYDKIQSVVSSIPTVNNATLTIQKNGTNVQTFTANQSTNATANITVPTDTSDLTNWAGFITWITSWDVTTALWYTPYNSTNPSWYVTSSIINDTAYWSWWNSDTTHAPTKNAVYDKLNAMDTTIAWKQAALATQTAYTSKGTSTKVPTITTNTLWQVTAISETNIAFPVTSVNGQTWAITWLASMSTITVTLTSAWWSSNSQTVSATGVTASNTVIVSPAPSDIADYADCGVYGYWQWSWTVTFKCDTAPSGDIVVNVLIMS